MTWDNAICNSCGCKIVVEEKIEEKIECPICKNGMLIHTNEMFDDTKTITDGILIGKKNEFRDTNKPTNTPYRVKESLEYLEKMKTRYVSLNGVRGMEIDNAITARDILRRCDNNPYFLQSHGYILTNTGRLFHSCIKEKLCPFCKEMIGVQQYNKHGKECRKVKGEQLTSKISPIEKPNIGIIEEQPKPMAKNRNSDRIRYE